MSDKDSSVIMQIPFDLTDTSDHIRMYRIKYNYTDFFRNHGYQSVQLNIDGHVSTYIGIVLNIDNRYYLVPLTSDKNNSLTDTWHQIVIPKNDTEKYGVALFHNMIPVPLLALELIDFEQLKKDNEDYFNVIFNEYQILNRPDMKQRCYATALEVYQASLGIKGGGGWLKSKLKTDIPRAILLYEEFLLKLTSGEITL
ncbi:type III toxin-antitoxin system ToxN/AbiQ family toxin [Erysipelothrix rhusiopathiae]|uniref:type III toxin-antitoxin system ToxN/AbiQ family toxin n=1 Tax=Erysipelothrix rhusiopathiae TaxID=1648 RepID=UPI002480351B|nr:type III toxin-antitoxin system ToxN/AbiQ family toxin [Erysipelothrix rhusiopathiae]